MSTDPLNFSMFSVIFEVIRQVDIFNQFFFHTRSKVLLNNN
jgi:hypothetical protein